jgi:hypothetical protein
MLLVAHRSPTTTLGQARGRRGGSGWNTAALVCKGLRITGFARMRHLPRVKPHRDDGEPPGHRDLRHPRLAGEGRAHPLRINTGEPSEVAYPHFPVVMNSSGMQLLVFAQQFFLGLNVVRILDDASWLRRADKPTLRFVLGADAFGALVWVDHVDRSSRRRTRS